MSMYSRPDPFAALAAPDLARATDAAGQPVDTLSGMGEALLDLVGQAAVARGVALPARQTVYMAPIPADCEQVAVLFSGWNPTPGLEGPTDCRTFRWLAGYSVIITRCTPAVQRGKGLVAPEAMTEAARIASADSEVLLEVVNRLDEVGPDLSVVANPPHGGFQTVELNVQLLSTGF